MCLGEYLPPQKILRMWQKWNYVEVKLISSPCVTCFNSGSFNFILIGLLLLNFFFFFLSFTFWFVTKIFWSVLNIIMFFIHPSMLGHVASKSHTLSAVFGGKTKFCQSMLKWQIFTVNSFLSHCPETQTSLDPVIKGVL